MSVELCGRLLGMGSLIFAMVAMEFVVVNQTSALTLSVAGTLKARRACASAAGLLVVVVVVGPCSSSSSSAPPAHGPRQEMLAIAAAEGVFHERLTRSNVAGMVCCLLGVQLYSWLKLRSPGASGGGLGGGGGGGTGGLGAAGAAGVRRGLLSRGGGYERGGYNGYHGGGYNGGANGRHACMGGGPHRPPQRARGPSYYNTRGNASDPGYHRQPRY